MSGDGGLRYEGFNYDEMGNRRQNNHLGRWGWTWFNRRDNGLNQYLDWGGTAINHQENGAIIQDGWISATYNAINQPVSISSPTSNGTMWFGYDPVGRCVKRWVGPSGSELSNPATYLYYDGWNLIEEGSSATRPTRNYVHGARVDEIVKSLKPTTGEEAYHQYDARGHAILLTNSGGSILEQYEYDVFGQPYFYDAQGQPMTVNGQPASTWGNRFLFTGREWLKDLGIYDYRHRLYQPELGRFLQPDPKQFEAGDYNLYRYCHNDPVNKSDPDGQMPLTKLTVKGIEKFLKTKTAHQLIAKGRNLIAGSKKEAVRAVEKSKPGSKAVFHTKDSTAQKLGPHAQPKPRGGNKSHVFDRSQTNMPALRNAARAVTAGAYLGVDSPAAQVIDFISPLSIGQDVFDVIDAFNEAAHQVDIDAANDQGSN